MQKDKPQYSSPPLYERVRELHPSDEESKKKEWNLATKTERLMARQLSCMSGIGGTAEWFGHDLYVRKGELKFKSVGLLRRLRDQKSLRAMSDIIEEVEPSWRQQMELEAVVSDKLQCFLLCHLLRVCNALSGKQEWWAYQWENVNPFLSNPLFDHKIERRRTIKQDAKQNVWPPMARIVASEKVLPDWTEKDCYQLDNIDRFIRDKKGIYLRAIREFKLHEAQDDWEAARAAITTEEHALQESTECEANKAKLEKRFEAFGTIFQDYQTNIRAIRKVARVLTPLRKPDPSPILRGIGVPVKERLNALLEAGQAKYWLGGRETVLVEGIASPSAQFPILAAATFMMVDMAVTPAKYPVFLKRCKRPHCPYFLFAQRLSKRFCWKHSEHKR